MTADNSHSMILQVNAHDEPIGPIDKLYAHQHNICHRAFSVFIFRQSGQAIELLLQKRQATKYHSPNLWANTCCSHPAPGQDIHEAAQARLQFEMGCQTVLQYAGKFHYQTPCTNALYENEWDYLFYAFDNHITPQPNADEVADYQWMTLPALENAIQKTPTLYCPWLPLCLNRLNKHNITCGPC